MIMDGYLGPAGDGDVYNPANVAAFINHVRAYTGAKGVHLMMADGVREKIS
jgi:hypothetical protein